MQGIAIRDPVGIGTYNHIVELVFFGYVCLPRLIERLSLTFPRMARSSERYQVDTYGRYLDGE